MITIWTAGIVLAVLIAGGVFLAYKAEDRRLPLVVACGILTVLIGASGFGTYPVAREAFQAAAVGGYKETLNGSVVDALVDKTVCKKVKQDEGGSNCARTEPCDSYTDYVWKDVPDGKGGTKQELKPVTKWYDCPVRRVEYDYILVAEAYFTFRFPVAQSVFGPESEPTGFVSLRDFSDIPDAPPKKWLAAKAALAAGRTFSITAPNTYKNYILASDKEAKKQYLDEIEALERDGLLPAHTRNIEDPIYDDFKADKAMFVKIPEKAVNHAAFQAAVMDYNAAFGSLQQGDLHLVVIRASALPKGMLPEDYIRLLKTYWLGHFGKDAFPKNAVALVIAVDDQARNIEWARAASGMPLGNNEMFLGLQFGLENQPFTIDKMFGTTTASVIKKTTPEGAKYDVNYQVGDGIIPNVAILDEALQFKRPCMECDDEGEEDQAGYIALKDLIPISVLGIFLAVLFEIFLGLLLGVIVMGIYIRYTQTYPRFMQSSY